MIGNCSECSEEVECSKNRSLTVTWLSPEEMAFELGSEVLARWKGTVAGVGREQVRELSKFKALKGQCGWNTDSNGGGLGNQLIGCQEGEYAGLCQPVSHFCL